MSLPRTFVYIDGFNLYYGALKGTPYRWLNPEALVRYYLPDIDLLRIRYFTARVSALPHDADAPQRQKRYLEALETLGLVEVTYGYFQQKVKRLPEAKPPHRTVKVLKTEEKGSDVNLATHLVNDAHLNRFDLAIVISNDSDLVNAVKLTRKDAGKKVGLLRTKSNRGQALTKAANFTKSIEDKALLASQFPDPIIAKGGKKYSKPRGW